MQEQFKERTRKWVAVAAELEKSRNDPVTCPFCEAATLVVYDAPFNNKGGYERWVHCPQCKEKTEFLVGPLGSD